MWQESGAETIRRLQAQLQVATHRQGWCSVFLSNAEARQRAAHEEVNRIDVSLQRKAQALGAPPVHPPAVSGMPRHCLHICSINSEHLLLYLHM